MAVVYRHRRLNDFSIFYVGIGVDKTRPTKKSNRSEWWKRTVNKYGYEIELVADDIPYEQAKELEIFLIKEYGRANLGEGKLVNMTDGGDGVTRGLNCGRVKRPVEQYSLLGDKINTFNSLSSAAKILSIRVNNIVQVCKRRRKTAGGYQWKYTDSDEVISVYKRSVSEASLRNLRFYKVKRKKIENEG